MRISCLGTEWIPGKEETLLSTFLLSVKWWTVGNSFRNKRSKEVCIVVLWHYVHCDYHISPCLEMCYLITELTTNSKNVSWNYRYWDNFEIDACHNHLNEQNADSQLTKENGKLHFLDCLVTRNYLELRERTTNSSVQKSDPYREIDYLTNHRITRLHTKPLLSRLKREQHD